MLKLITGEYSFSGGNRPDVSSLSEVMNGAQWPGYRFGLICVHGWRLEEQQKHM